MCNKNVTYQPESDDFYNVLSSRVNQLFPVSSSRHANAFFYFKALLLIGAYWLFYYLLITSNNSTVAMIAMVLMGPLAILIGINVAHDAAHGTISQKKWVNKVFLQLFDLLGANSYMWKKRHVNSHHAFPNIMNKDADLKQNPLVRIFPSDTIKKIHKYQFIYAPFLYLLYTVNWLYFRDFKDFTESQIGSLNIKSHKRIELVKLVSFKLIYVGYIIVLPLLFSSLNWQTYILCFFLMNFAASLLITLALVPSHVSEDSIFLLPDENGVMPHSWSHHQVLSVIDFATNNWFLNFFFGGFNHHLTHHLFPKINHVHSTKITPIIKQTVEEYGLQYQHQDSFLRAYLSHFKLLKNNGVQPQNATA